MEKLLIDALKKEKEKDNQYMYKLKRPMAIAIDLNNVHNRVSDEYKSAVDFYEMIA